MKLIEILKELVDKGIHSASLTYSLKHEQFLIDLATQAKSELYLYEDGTIRGRYDYEYKMDLEDENLFQGLLREYEHAKHGRDFGNPEWEKHSNSVS